MWVYNFRCPQMYWATTVINWGPFMGGSWRNGMSYCAEKNHFHFDMESYLSVKKKWLAKIFSGFGSILSTFVWQRLLFIFLNPVLCFFLCYHEIQYVTGRSRSVCFSNIFWFRDPGTIFAHFPTFTYDAWLCLMHHGLVVERWFHCDPVLPYGDGCMGQHWLN